MSWGLGVPGLALGLATGWWMLTASAAAVLLAGTVLNAIYIVHLVTAARGTSGRGQR